MQQFRFTFQDGDAFIPQNFLVPFYVCILLYNLMQIRLSNPVELLHSGSTGEREPKTKILQAVLGVVCIAAGYYMAITVDNPVKAITLFFVAVMLVIIGTYWLLMPAVSHF